MLEFLRDQASDSEEVVTPLMLDGTYLSRNFATLGPFPLGTTGYAIKCRLIHWYKKYSLPATIPLRAITI